MYFLQPYSRQPLNLSIEKGILVPLSNLFLRCVWISAACMDFLVRLRLLARLSLFAALCDQWCDASHSNYSATS